MIISILAGLIVMSLGIVIWYAFESPAPVEQAKSDAVAFIYEGYGPSKDKATKPNKPR